MIMNSIYFLMFYHLVDELGLMIIKWRTYGQATVSTRSPKLTVSTRSPKLTAMSLFNKDKWPLKQ